MYTLYRKLQCYKCPRANFGLFSLQTSQFQRKETKISSRTFVTSKLPTQNVHDFNEVKLEFAEDRKWIQSDSGKSVMGMAMKTLIGNDPRYHLMASDIRSYIKSRGVLLDADKLDPAGMGVIQRDIDSIKADYEAGQAELMRAFKGKEFDKIEEIERKILSLEEERRHTLQNFKTTKGSNVAISTLPSSSSLRKLTDVLTFPLTLAYGIRKIFNQPLSQANVLLVGARAESSLPGIWWRDTLIACDKVQYMLVFKLLCIRNCE